MLVPVQIDKFALETKESIVELLKPFRKFVNVARKEVIDAAHKLNSRPKKYRTYRFGC